MCAPGAERAMLPARTTHPRFQIVPFRFDGWHLDRDGEPSFERTGASDEL